MALPEGANRSGMARFSHGRKSGGSARGLQNYLVSVDEEVIDGTSPVSSRIPIEQT
jgi:hypothetical protein